jgi:hypothetical protein
MAPRRCHHEKAQTFQSMKGREVRFGNLPPDELEPLFSLILLYLQVTLCFFSPSEKMKFLTLCFLPQ